MKWTALLIVAMMLIVPMLPSVSAQGRSTGKTVTVTELVSYEQYGNLTWTDTLNLSDASDLANKTNYNLTIAPFLHDAEVSGIVIAPFFAPIIINTTASDRDISVAQMFRLLPENIMDGASEFWVRVPVLDIPADANITLRLGRVVGSSAGLNLTYADFASPSFTEKVVPVLNVTDMPGASLTLIADTGAPQRWSDFRHYQNDTPYNFTWLRVCAPLFPNECYLLMFDVQYSTGHSGEVRIAVTQDDFASDGLYASWLWLNGTGYAFGFDLDTSMVLTYGIASGVSGIGTEDRYHFTHYPTETKFHINSTIPINQDATFDYLNIMVPFLLDTSYISSANITWGLTLYSSPDDSDVLAHTSVSGSYDSNLNYFLYDWSIVALSGDYIDHIQIDAMMQGGLLYNDSSIAVKFWGRYEVANSTGFDQINAYTDLYFRAVYGGTVNYYPVERHGDILYSHIAQADTAWTMTDKPVLVIPVNTPSTIPGIKQTIQSFEYYLERSSDNVSGKANNFFDVLGHALKLYFDTVLHTDSSTVAYALLGPIGVIMWLNAHADEFGIDNGFAIFIHQIATFIVDAIEWTSYWVVRGVYAFSLLIVYVINVYGVISINSALHSYSRNGNLRDFVRTFRMGWKFVLAILSLLLSLAILAIGILSAVIPL